MMSPAEKRKVQEIGGSLLVVIPKWWCRKHGVEAGDFVDIEELNDGSLKVVKGEAPKEVAA